MISMYPRWLFGPIGLVNPMMREIGKMAYLWENPMELQDARLDAILGPDFATPFDEAVAVTVAPFFAEERVAAQEPQFLPHIFRASSRGLSRRLSRGCGAFRLASFLPSSSRMSLWKV